MTAHDLFIAALTKMNHRGEGWLSDYLHLWLMPKERIRVDFLGENDKVRVWWFRVIDPDDRVFKMAFPEAVEMPKKKLEHNGFTRRAFKIQVPKFPDSGG